jgi:hypothetical protein
MSEETPKAPEPFVLDFIPQAKDLVYTADPDDPLAPHVLTFIVRKATWQDKVDYILRMKRMGETMEKRSMRQWFKDQNIFVTIEDEQVVFCHLDFIRSLVSRNSKENE